MQVQLELDGTVTPVPDRPPRSFVYFVRVAGQSVFKVGISDNPEKRLAGLQTGCPYELQLCYCLGDRCGSSRAAITPRSIICASAR